MSMELLDKNGLAYFWGKIKSYVAGLLSSKADDSGVVHLAGDESVTGTKTFVGSKKVAFKQSANNDKLGFTLFNNSNVEQGYLEYNPTNKISGVPLMTLGNYASAAAGLSYVGFRKYSSISGASGAYNLLTPLISDARTPFNLTTTYTNFFLPLGVTDGTTIVVTDKSGLLDISSLLVSIDSSDAITAMTGYSKPSTGSAITVNDSLNDAIGKLEARLDSVVSDNFPLGTRMLFQQSAAPTGWTKETDSGYNDIALRLTTGNLANKTNGKAFTTCMATGRATANATQGGTIGDKTAGGTIGDKTAGGTVGNKALSVAMLAKHRHGAPGHKWVSGGSQRLTMYALDTSDGTTPYYTEYTGSGSNHDHSFTGTAHNHTFTGTAHNHTFTGSAHSHTIDLDINYIDCIIATKA